MPQMPYGDPWPSILGFLRAERAIRSGQVLSAEDDRLDPYWQDLLRLLRALRHYRDNEFEMVSQIKSQMVNRVYREFIAAREAPRRQA